MQAEAPRSSHLERQHKCSHFLLFAQHQDTCYHRFQEILFGHSSRESVPAKVAISSPSGAVSGAGWQPTLAFRAHPRTESSLPPPFCSQSEIMLTLFNF